MHTLVTYASQHNATAQIAEVVASCAGNRMTRGPPARWTSGR